MKSKFKLVVLSAVIASLVTLTACSFSTNFVVVNASNDRIQVRYVIKERTHALPAELFETPSIKKVSELDDHDVLWRPLPDSQWTFNAETRTAVVTLLPQEVLRVETENGFCGEDTAERREYFYIEEINITGANGAIRLTGEQVRRSFVRGTKQRCELTYR